MLILLLIPHKSQRLCHNNMLKKYKDRESIPVADVACVVQHVHTRHEAIMLIKLSIMLLSSAQKITYQTFEKFLIMPLTNVSFMAVSDH